MGYRWHRDFRDFLGEEAFGRNLEGQLVEDEEGYEEAVKQLRSKEARLIPASSVRERKPLRQLPIKLGQLPPSSRYHRASWH